MVAKVRGGKAKVPGKFPVLIFCASLVLGWLFGYTKLEYGEMLQIFKIEILWTLYLYWDPFLITVYFYLEKNTLFVFLLFFL